MLPRIDELGTEKHFNHFPAGWAWAMCTPFHWSKQVASHLGGTRNPTIVKWPSKIKKTQAVHSQFTHVIDIAPTILEAAGIEEPRSVNGIAQMPVGPPRPEVDVAISERDAQSRPLCRTVTAISPRRRPSAPDISRALSSVRGSDAGLLRTTSGEQQPRTFIRLECG